MLDNNRQHIYFAADDKERTASTLMSKAEAWTNNIESMGYLDKLRAMFAAYHGAYYNDISNGHQISFGGEQGELVQLPIDVIVT
jgi:hypothetical protein